MFSVALSVGLRRPGVTWHLCPLEPGLSSLANAIGTRATARSALEYEYTLRAQTVDFAANFSFTLSELNKREGLLPRHAYRHHHSKFG